MPRNGQRLGMPRNGQRLGMPMNVQNNRFLNGMARNGKDRIIKEDNPKILDTYFSVFRYSKPFGAHATSNVYIYIQGDHQKTLFSVFLNCAITKRFYEKLYTPLERALKMLSSNTGSNYGYTLFCEEIHDFK